MNFNPIPIRIRLGYELDIVDDFGKPLLAVAGRLRQGGLFHVPVSVDCIDVALK